MNGVWRCFNCKKNESELEAPAVGIRCRPCRDRLFGGENNPNFKNAGNKICAQCGTSFKHYQKTRKYCSANCYHSTRPKRQIFVQLSFKFVPQKTVKVKRERARRNCLQCGTSFPFSPSQKRLYCSYACHIKSGGAFRAGLASAKMTRKYGARKDANHNEVFDEIRKHCEAVYDLSNAGCGLPDGIAWISDAWRLFEVKNPKTGYGRRGLNAVQRKWLSQWKGASVYLIYGIEDAAKFGRGDLDGVKSLSAEDVKL